jgi:C4-dicarboxylate transporter, DctQ subunit
VLATLNARLVYFLLAAAAALAFALSFLVVADIIGRSAFNSPVQGTPELVSMAIVIICFLLAGYAVWSRSMIFADVLIKAFGWRGPCFATMLSGVLGAILFALIAWGTWEPLLHAIASGEYEGEGALRVPTWPARVGVMVGSTLVALNYVGQAVTSLLLLLQNQAPQDAAVQRAGH